MPEQDNSRTTKKALPSWLQMLIAFAGGFVLMGILILIRKENVTAERDWLNIASDCAAVPFCLFLAGWLAIVLFRLNRTSPRAYQKFVSNETKSGQMHKYNNFEEYLKGQPKHRFKTYVLLVPCLFFCVLAIVLTLFWSGVL